MGSAESPAALFTTQRVRDLWVLREQAKVRAAEFRFLKQLETILNQHIHQVYTTDKESYVRRIQLSLDNNNGCYYLDNEEQDEHHRNSSRVPTRERSYRYSSVAEVQMVQQRRPVTGLSEEYRSLLEGNMDPPPRQSWFGGDLWRQVIEQQTVSNALSSSFRHQLELALLHSPSAHAVSITGRSSPSHEDASDSRRQEQVNWDDFSNMEEALEGINVSETNHESSILDQMAKLSMEVQWIKNTMQATFDLQLEMQREIRQEIAAMLNERKLSKSFHSSLVTDSKPVSRGTCTICAQNSVDSLLYSCGHMCTCCYCGRQLIATGQTCPICRAPVKDVVRAYVSGGDG